MKVSELGEFGLIDLLNKTIARSRRPSPAWKRLLIGIGDDAAAWEIIGPVQLATTDTMVQDVHFSLATTDFTDLGWKALATNVSDIAAMGGQPEYALVTLALPGDTQSEDMVALYKGMMKMANHCGVALVGGDIVRAPQLVITITVLGSAAKEGLLTRSAARPGDKIAVTNYLGNSAGGLRMLQTGLELDRRTTALLKQAHLRPMPRVEEGKLLVSHGVRAAIDISDGLVADLGHICEMSGVAAIIHLEQLPIHPVLKKAFPEEHVGMALSGGEDYELLFTAPSKVMEKVQHAAPCPITVIGEIGRGKHGKVTVLDAGGNAISLKEKGWDHFAACS
jgi:thiamine-monophosphate kinase